jgi:hypothetical protein
MTEPRSAAPVSRGGPPAATILIHAGIVALVLGMASFVAGILATPFLRPGLWLILLAFLAIAAGALGRTLGAAEPAGPGRN